MKLEEFSLLTDENISTDFLSHLRSRQFDVKDVKESKLIGSTDEVLMQNALTESRIIITQDRDFGKLVYASGKAFMGIIYLRPGHFEPLFHAETLEAILKSGLDFVVPFILVAINKNGNVKIRLRNSIRV